MRRLLMLSMLLLAGLALQAQAPPTLWLFGSQTSILFDPAVGSDGSAYYATTDNKLGAVSGTGVHRWLVDVGAQVMTPVAIQGNSLYVGTSSQQIRAYSVAGNLIWKSDIDKNIKNTIAVSGDNKLFFGTLNGYVWAMDGNTGAVLWKFYLDTEVGPPSIGRDGTVYFVGNAFMNAVNPANGHIYWHKDAYNFSNVPLVFDGEDHIVYIRRGGYVDCYDLRGNFLWEAYDDTGTVILANMVQPILYGDMVIFASEGGGDIYAMDVNSGAVLWQYSEANADNPLQFAPIAVSTLAVDAQGTVFMCDTSGGGTLAWLDSATGWIQGWMPSHGYGNNVAITGRDTAGYGVIRCGNGNKTLVAYKMPAGPGGPYGQYLGSAYHQARRDDPPLVSLMSPVDGALITGPMTASASASDDYNLTKLSLYLDKTLLATTQSSALSFSADSAMFQDGVYDVTAVALDSGGNQSTETATIALVNPTPVYGVGMTPLIFGWMPNGVDNKYRVDISTSLGFGSVLITSAKPGHNFIKGTAWQPSTKKWKKVQEAALASPSNQTTFYWRVTGKTGGQVLVRSFILSKSN
jgi:outer membrane protein assembly factor BamB